MLWPVFVEGIAVRGKGRNSVGRGGNWREVDSSGEDGGEDLFAKVVVQIARF